MDFQNRVVVLTGVGREGQLGEALARAFAERGAMLVLVDRQAQEVGARAAALRAAGHRAWAFACDLTDPQQVTELARRTAATHGSRVDALVCTAGGFASSGPVAESDPAVLAQQLAINVSTAYLATRAFLPLLRPANGAIVYFASEAVLPGSRTARMSAYAIAKSGVVALMRAVAEEEEDSGIRANAVAPAAIRTSANVQSMDERTPLVPREAVCDVVLWLCSDAARAVRGQLVRVSA